MSDQRVHSIFAQYVSRFPFLVSRWEQCPLDPRPYVRIGECFEDEDATPRQERYGEFEAWVLRRRADERDDAGLDPRQKRILLRLVEAKDLVAEEDRALPLILEAVLRFLDDFAHAR